MTVSVVMPIYNEEKYIEKCILSLLNQDYPQEDMEWIFVDGNSTDKTVEILNGFVQQYPDLIKLKSNPKRIVPCAMNIGIRESVGKYIVRLDAHADYAKDYISKCVYYLDTSDAENVGGVIETKSRGFVGCTIARMLSSKFGVGNSQFRTNGKTGYVDTVPFGAFRRTFFEKYGGFDERLARNEDNEINYRIRKNGGKILLSEEICSSYYCRDSVGGICDMARKNGMWNIIAMKLCPGSMGIRHFIPLCFVLSILLLAGLGFALPLFWYILIGEMGLYFILDIIFSAIQCKNAGMFFLLLFLFPVFHIAYGIGSLSGIFMLLKKRYRSKKYLPPVIDELSTEQAKET